MKKFVCFIFVVTILVMTFTVNAGAMPAPYFFGDANADNTMDVLDASFVQEYISKLNTMSLLQEMLSDVDADSKITIVDATMIQQRIAKIIRKFPAGMGIYVYILLGEMVCNRVSGAVGVNEPVTFTANPDGRCKPFTYDFYINDVLIEEDSPNNSFTYTFEESGYYNVKITVTNTVGVSASTNTIFYIK